MATAHPDGGPREGYSHEASSSSATVVHTD